MASKLFLLEFQIGNIEFEHTFKSIPAKDEVLVNIKFFNVSLDIDPTEIQIDADSVGLEHSKKIVFNMGKSYLFTTTVSQILDKMKAGKIELSLRINNRTEGSTMVPWKEEFLEMVKLFEKIGITGTNYRENSSMRNKSDELIAKMDVYIRLSCYDDFIESEYFIKSGGAGKEYYFKNPAEKTIFKCDIIEGNTILPVTKLMNVASRAQAADVVHTLSWTEIFGVGDMPSKESYSPFAVDVQGPIALTEILQKNSVETVSMVFRPDENKFYDLLDDFNPKLSATQDPKKPMSVKDDKVRSKRESVKAKADDPLELTADKINRKLCKNKDCPAAKKFKEFGIGPLATGKGLGTVYNDVESTVEYGLSNTYGTMKKYGPFGIFTRPKNPEQPYLPPSNDQETKSSPKPEKKLCCYCSRLRGGGPWPDEPFVLIENSVENKITREDTAPLGILRLRGGGPEPSRKGSSSEKLQKDLQPPRCIRRQMWAELLRLRGGGPFEPDEVPAWLKSPIKECKPVMDKFDEILAAYKKVLGPCGQATCSNSPALVEERCQEVCREGKSPSQAEDMGTGRDESIKRILCENPCDPTKSIPSAACGNPKCAYVKYKLDLVDDDAALELEYLPPAVSGRCGHAKCRYPLEPDLPPIHWDCPDPLPKGKCKNLNCPYQPRQLRKFKIKEPKPGPCGSTDCPYALPPPCEIPTCPFKPKPCPFLEKQEEEDMCENPECPFANEHIDPSESFDENLPIKGQFVTCSNVVCPFTTQGTRRPKPKSDKPNVCESPACPFSKVKKVTICEHPLCPSAPKPACPFTLPPKHRNDICGNPLCPFASPPSQEDDDICDNPQCPASPKTKKCPSTAKSPCPFTLPTENGNDIYGNLHCPFAPPPSREDDDICDNPRCPSSPKTEKCPSAPKPPCPFTLPSKKENDICGNPHCPFAPPQEDDDVCDNPQCPFSPRTKKSPSAPKPPCPFTLPAKKGNDICENPHCPFAPPPSQEDDDFCDNPQCPSVPKPKNNVCSNPRCPNASKIKEKESVCSNPDCPGAPKRRKKKNDGCGDPACPNTLEQKQDDFIGGDPQCPFAEDKQKKSCKDDTSEYFKPDNNGDNCDNPECPDHKEKHSDDSADSKSKESICINPDCPYAENESLNEDDEICDNPLCPYALPLPSCGIPGCPYEPVPVMPCPGPKKAKKRKKLKTSRRKSSGGEASVLKESTIPAEQEVVQVTVEGGVIDTIKKGKKRKCSKFVYSMGKQYTGVQLGHKECVTPMFKVPPKMGWLWNVPLIMTKNYKPRRGWKPGAIQRSIAARIKAHREAKGLGILNVPKFYRGNEGPVNDADYEVPVVPKPTLQIQKKEGAYWITMNPLKDPKTLVYRENPYMECTPMQFKITKNNKKKEIGDDESKLCYCDEEQEAESSSDSELDIEFTPPAGIIHPERFKKKNNIIHCEVQYDPKDFASKKDTKDGKDKGKKGKGKGGKKGKKK